MVRSFARAQWRGKITVMPAKTGGYEYLQFEPDAGKSFIFDVKSNTKAKSDLITK